MTNLRMTLKQTHWIFVVVALIFGLTFIKLVPPMWGVDEPAHFARAYEISKGRVFAEELANGKYGGPVPPGFNKLNTLLGHDIANLKYAEPFYARNDVPDMARYSQAASEPLREAPGSTATFPNTAIYSPLAYVGSVIGLWFAELFRADLGTAITCARLGTLLVYVALVFIALRLLARYKVRWLMFVVATLPMCVFQASIVNVDSLAIGESLLLFAVYVRLWSSKPKEVDRRLLALLAVLAVALPLTKPNYALLLLPIAFLPKHVWPRPNRSWAYKLAILITSFILLWLWTYGVREPANALPLSLDSTTASAIHPTEQLRYVVGNLPEFVVTAGASAVVNDTWWFVGMFGMFGWNILFLPVSIVAVLLLLLCVATFYGNGTPSRILRRRGVMFLSAALLTVGGVIMTLYMTWTPLHARIVSGVQGRYFIPAIIFVLYGLRLLLPIKLEGSQRILHGLFVAIPVLSLLFTTVYYRTVL